MILFAAAGILLGGYSAFYAVHSFQRKKAPAGAGALLLTLFCLAMAGILTAC